MKSNYGISKDLCIRYLLVKKSNSNFRVEKSDWYYFNQVIKINTTSYGTNQYHLPSGLAYGEGQSIISVHNRKLIMQGAHLPTLHDVLLYILPFKSTLPVLFKNLKGMNKGKERLRTVSDEWRLNLWSCTRKSSFPFVKRKSFVLTSKIWVSSIDLIFFFFFGHNN